LKEHPALKIVDDSNPIPKYLQISAWLKELIQTGRYKAGEKLPPEVQLSKMCDVNRNTVRQAISELTAAGLLRKEKGTGTFVATQARAELRQKLERISSFSDFLQGSGIVQETRLLHKSVEDAPDDIARLLFLGSNKKVITVQRVRVGDGVPYIYEESYLPHGPFKDILEMDLTGSMYHIISEQFGIVLARSKQTISAINLNTKIARILELPANAAGFFMETLTFDENSMPIEALYSYHRGDKYKLEIELERYDDTSNKIVLFAET
jgi:GntR family transcriptional regulator